MVNQQRLIIIGGGPAGVEAALIAARLGARTTLISDGPIGGRAVWDSLLPSKAWLTAADMAGEAAEMGAFGFSLDPSTLGMNPPTLLNRLELTKKGWSAFQEQELTSLGVEIIHGQAAFVADRTIEIVTDDKPIRHEAEKFIIATGSNPSFPEGLKPDGKRVLAPRFASHLSNLPQSITVIGAGPTGSEFAYLFDRMGVAVIWIVDPFGVLPMFHPEAGRFLANKLQQRGVKIIYDHFATQITRHDDHVRVELDGYPSIETEMAFVAIGRQPDWSRLRLENAGLMHQNGPIPTDQFCRTSNPAVYLVGDADGGWMVANKAMAQASIAVRHALGVPVEPYDAGRILLATYTDPQVAQIGKLSGSDIATRRVSYDVSLKARLLPDAEGFVEIAYNQSGGRICGGLAVGNHAADVLAPLAVALVAGMTLDQLAATYVAHPALSELVFLAARAIS